eukprot:5963176-Ditylum_brightwellii.AAC.1
MATVTRGYEEHPSDSITSKKKVKEIEMKQTDVTSCLGVSPRNHNQQHLSTCAKSQCFQMMSKDKRLSTTNYVRCIKFMRAKM